MKKSMITLGTGVLLVAACSSATSVDAELQEYRDKVAACVGNATTEQVAECKQKATGYDKLLKAECVAVYARAYDCMLGTATCTNKTIQFDEAKASTTCKTQLDEAAKCQEQPGTATGAQPQNVNARLVAEGQSDNHAATRAEVFRRLSGMVDAVRSKR